MTAEKRRAILRKTGDSDVQDLLDLIEELEARLALAERLADAVERWDRDAKLDALSAFRESEKKG